jgi:hypothetical protein
MSTISVTNITTANGSTNLVIATGNTSAPTVVLTTLGELYVGNSTINATHSSSLLQVSNSTSTANINSLGLTVGNTVVNSTIITVGNTVVNSTFITVGNSTVNVFTNGSHLDVTSNTGFLLGTPGASKTANGYTWLPNGLLMQWGSVAANVTTGNATFPIAFSTECLSVTANRRISGANGFCSIIGVNTSVAQIRTANNTSVNCFYMAIGY